MKLIKQMINNYKQKFSIILGFILCCLIIWNRFLRVRSPYYLQDISFTYLFIIISLIAFSLLFFFSIIKIFNINIPAKSFISENFIIYSIVNYIKEAPKVFFAFIYNKYSFRFLETPMSHAVVYLYNDKGILFISLLILCPLVIIAIIFFAEILIFNYVFLFIKALYLLIVSLILRVSVYISKTHASANLDYIRTYLEFFRNENEEQIYVRLKDEFENVHPPTSLEACMAYYDIYINIKNFCEAINKKEEELKPYFMFIYSSLFIISWVYIFIVN